MEKTNIPIKGMHCASCEILIEDELSKVAGVKSAKLNHKDANAEIFYEGKLDHNEVSSAIHRAGYSIGKDKKTFFSRNSEDYTFLGIVVSLIFIIWYIFTNFKFFDFPSVISGNYSSLPIVFLVGLTAGVSTCMALVGGLVLGASARFAEMHPNATKTQKFTPHLFFNIGRIATFFVLGGIIGMAGSIFQLSSSVLGILTVAIGLVMLTLGMQLINLFPQFSAIKITMPKAISRFLGVKSTSEKEYSHRNSMFLGGLTFFLPCGFTQAMQLFAISSGDLITGSLTMGVFALGTTPGLLGIGGITSVVKGAFSNVFFKFAGVVVILLAFFNISNGLNLTGFSISSIFASNQGNVAASDPNVVLENGVQIVRMNQVSNGYEPNSFTIKKGIPVKWIVNSIDPYSCASSIVSPTLNIRQALTAGENIFNFTPNEVGQIRFSCSMGMYTGVFNVVDETSGSQGSGVLPQQQAAVAQAAPQQGGSCGGSGGCGCGGGAKAAVPQGPAVAADQQGNIQVIKTIYTLNGDIQPNSFTVKSGIPVRMEIEVKESGSGCMGTIMIPGLANQAQVLTKGQNITFNFTPQKTGNFPITCAMGVPRGSIQVN